MQYFHEPIINVPAPKHLSLITAQDAIARLRRNNELKFSKCDILELADCKTVRDLQDEKAIDTFRHLFNTYFPFLGNDSLRLIYCDHTDMARYTCLNGIVTASIVIDAAPKGHMLQVMTERHFALSDYETPSMKILNPGDSFLMDADSWHSFRLAQMHDQSIKRTLYILQADVDYRWFIPEHAINSQKHWVIGDILRVAKANAAGEQYHPPQPLPKPIVKNADLYNRDLPSSSSSGIY